MRQLLQSASGGGAEVVDVPAPTVRPGCVLVRTGASLVSAGTERSVVSFARKSLLAKARARPDLVAKVVEKARTDGPVTALKAALTRLDQPLALGYSSAGVVVEVGEGVDGFRPGDLVACAGGGYASHAEMVCVPRNLVAPVPAGVTAEHAAFATVGAIGLHGMRLAEVQLGERVAVIGLGLIGLMVVQLLKAAGVRVLGVDLDPARVKLALDLGADAAVVSGQGDPGAEALALSGGAGMDAVLITAGTDSNEPVALAGRLARDRARVVVVGAVGMDLPRPPFFEKELSFRVSRSYGPGRYDPSYEEGGLDYPVGYVRWTENRNLTAVLECMASGGLRVDPLVTHRIPIEEGARAYALLTEGGEPSLGVVLTYGEALPSVAPGRRVALGAPSAPRPTEPGVGVLGAGNFALGTLLPAMKAAGGFRFTGVASARGASARHAAEKHGFAFAASDEAEILRDAGTDLVAILTRHDLHAAQIVAALEAGKHVFCEKPPCLDAGELASIVTALSRAGEGRTLTVGYNRRFAPMTRRLRDHLRSVGEPIVAHVRVNAGFIPAEHWVHDPAVGGGRIIGELCHFVDLAGALTDAVPVRVGAFAAPDGGRYRRDNLSVVVSMSDGSVATITYAASGDRGLGKERVEAFAGGRAAVLDDFRELRLFGGGRPSVEKARLEQDKGHRREWEVLRGVLTGGGDAPIPLRSWVSTSLATFAVERALRTGEVEPVDAEAFIAEALRGEGGAS